MRNKCLSFPLGMLLGPLSSNLAPAQFKSESNNDSRPVEPGGTLTAADLEGLE
jgi:hypothetical protein